MTDSDAKEWVTIKIPEGVRDDARDDPRTYGEIMRDGLETTETPNELGSVDTDAIADAVAARLEGSKPLEDMAFEDWFEPDYAQTIARHIEAEIEFGEIELNDRLARIESAAATAEERTGSIENTLEGLSR